MIQGIIAASARTSETLTEKYILSKKIMGYRGLTFMVFVIIAIIMLIGSPLFFSFNESMLEPKYLILMTVLIVTSLSYSILYFRALEKTSVENVEPLMLSNWIFTIILAVILFPAERGLFKIILAVVATVTLIALNIEDHHLKLDKYAYWVFGSAILLAIAHVSIMPLLNVYNPFTLYWIRAILVTMLMLPFFGIRHEDWHVDKIKLVLPAAGLAIIKNLFVYWSYSINGIVTTSLFMTSAPIITIWGAKIFLKESLHTKNVLATVVVTLCIGMSLFI